MPQYTIYLDEETAKDMEKRAGTGKPSKSRVVADALKETNPRETARAWSLALTCLSRQQPSATIHNWSLATSGSSVVSPVLKLETW